MTVYVSVFDLVRHVDRISLMCLWLVKDVNEAIVPEKDSRKDHSIVEFISICCISKAVLGVLITDYDYRLRALLHHSVCSLLGFS